MDARSPEFSSPRWQGNPQCQPFCHGLPNQFFPSVPWVCESFFPYPGCPNQFFLTLSVRIGFSLPSHRLTWKCAGPCRKTTFLLERGFMHVSWWESLLGVKVWPSSVEFRSPTRAQGLAFGSTLQVTGVHQSTEVASVFVKFHRSGLPFAEEV